MTTIMVLFSPIIALMTWLLQVLYGLFGSYGVSIISLSIIVRLALYPIAKIARRFEERERLVQLKMMPDLAAAKEKFTGRERFEAIDSIYQKNGYHPIKSLAALAPLFLQIPFLLSAFYLFMNYPPLVTEPFLFFNDLSQPDGLLSIGSSLTINLLPITLTAIAVIESMIKPSSTGQTQVKFFIVAVVLLVLIYPLPAAVGLYWFTSNFWSFLGTLYGRVKWKEKNTTARQ